MVFEEVVTQDSEYRHETALSHLLDFINLEWKPWQEFIQGMMRAFRTLSDARKVTAERTKRWLGRQVSVALSVMQDIEDNFTVKLLAHGRMRKGRERYSSLLLSDDLVGWRGAMPGA